MNKLKQKVLGYFGNNKILSCVVLIFAVLMILSWLWNFWISIRNFSSYLYDWLEIFRYIITLLFIINLFSVCLNLSKKIKLYTLLSYGVTYTIYEIIMLIYSISITEAEYEISIFWIFAHFAVIGLNTAILLLLNYRRKNIIVVVLFVIVNYYFNTIHTGGKIYFEGSFYFNFEDFVYYLEINFVYICIAAVVILLFIPIFKNQCPQCGFKNTKQAKFCGKCGHNLTENVFSLPFKK